MAKAKLEAFRLFKVIRSIHGRRSNGVLTLVSEGRTAKVRFALGRPVQVFSNQEENRLGPALVRQGLISSTEYQDLLASQSDSSQPFEQLVLEGDLVARPRLQRIEGKLARRRLLETFGWAEGEYEFQNMASHEEALIKPIDPTLLILEAVAQIVPTPLCDRFLRQFPRQFLEPTEVFETYKKRFNELFPAPNLLNQLGKGLRAEAVREQSGDRASNLRQGTALVLSGLCQLQIVRSRPAPQVDETSHTAPPIQLTPPAAASRPAEDIDIDPDATRPDPASIPPRQARRPSVPPHSRGRDSSQVVRPPNVRSRTIITAPPTEAPAVEIDSTPPTRNRTIEMRGQQPSRPPQARPRKPVEKVKRRSRTQRRSRPPQTAVPAPPVATTEDSAGRIFPPGMSDKDRQHLEEIFELVETIDGKNHYEMLGIQKNASDKMIRHAFRKLARQYHVDRFSRYELNRATLLTIQKVFIALNRANETLVDPHERQEYDVSLEFERQAAARAKTAAAKTGASTKDDHLQAALKAEQFVQTGTALIARGDATAALERFKTAIEITPADPLAVAGHAYAEYLVSQAQGGSKSIAVRALQTLTGVTNTTANLAEPFLYLGRVHRDLGDHAAAVDAFQSALRVNPHLSQASSELRYSKKRLEENSGGLKGLFGRKK